MLTVAVTCIFKWAVMVQCFMILRQVKLEHENKIILPHWQCVDGGDTHGFVFQMVWCEARINHTCSKLHSVNSTPPEYHYHQHLTC